MKKILWYAVNGNGQGRVFTAKPERSESLNIWVGDTNGSITMTILYMESIGFRLPALKWSDEPARLDLSLKVYMNLQ